MKAYTFWDSIKDFLWNNPYSKVEYFFAERWLNRNFGEHEYWGDYISGLIYNQD